MPEGFHGMLSSRGALGGYGPPRIGRGDPIGEAHSIAEDMKNEDMRRQMELMRFQQQMRIQDENRARHNAAMDRNAIDITGRKANKNYVTQYAPLTSMQQQFRQDELMKKQQDQATKLAEMNANARLKQALATGQLTADTAAANRTSRELIAEGNRTAQNERADADRTSREKIAETSRNTVQVMIGPDGKPHAIATNPRDATARELMLGDQPVGDIYNPGTRPKGVLKPEQQKGMDLASDMLDEINNNLLNVDDTLTDKAKWATGGTAWSQWIPTSQGRAGGASLNKVAAEKVLNLIGHLKSQSRTGATGMGNMSDKDMKILTDAATILKDPWLDEETIRKELVKVRNVLRATVKIEDGVSQPGRTQPRQSSFQPDPNAAANIARYGGTAGPAETASVYQPNTGRLPITGNGPATAAPVLRPNAQEALSILNRNKPQAVDTGVPVWQGSGNR